MRFSIIIPVRQVNDFLRENINHIKQLDYNDFEVLIITDVPQDYDFEGDSRFKIVVLAASPGEKRNYGAKLSSGDILAFLDDDAYPRSDWLTKASAVFAHEDPYALGGPAITPINVPIKERMSGLILSTWLASGNTTYRHTLSGRQRFVNDYPSVNLFVKKDAFFKVGGFSSEYWPGEDTKLCLDLVQAYGKDFLYSPIVVVYHHRRTVFGPHLKQVSRYGRYRGQFARILPKTSRLPQYFMPSLFCLGLISGPLISFFIPTMFKLYFWAVVLYLLLLLREGLIVYKSEKSLKSAAYVCLGVFLTHIVYGYNFVIGFFRRPELKLKSVNIKTGNYSEG